MDDGRTHEVRFRRAPDVLWRNVGADVLTARPRAEGFDLLSGGAGHVWRCLERPRTRAEVIELLAAGGALPEDPETAVQRVLDDLTDRGLVEPVADRGADRG